MAGPVIVAAAEQEIEVVDDRLHPGGHLFLQIPRQESHLLAQGDHRPCHQKPVIDPLVGHLVQARCQGQQGLAGAGLAHQRDQRHRRIEQQIEGEGLFAVAGLDPPEPQLRYPLQGIKGGAAAVHPAEQGVVRLGLVHQGHPFIGLQTARAAGPFGQVGQGQSALALDPIHLLGAEPHLTEAGVKVGDVHLVGGVVLGDQPHRIGLDPQVGVLGDEHHRRLTAHHLVQALLQGHGQDVVVTIAPLELRRQLAEGLAAAEHHPQAAATGRVDLHPIGQVALLAKFIQQPRHLAGVAALLGRIALEAIDLLDHLNRNDHVVVLEAGQRQGVMQQDIGIQHKGLAHDSDQSGSCGVKLRPLQHLRSARSLPVGFQACRSPFPYCSSLCWSTA